MTSKKDILERRQKVCQLIAEGLSSREIAVALKVALRTIQYDRQEINEEILEVLRGKTVENIISDFLLKYDSIYKEARKTYRNTSNDNAKIGALRIMQQQERDKILLLQSLGFLVSVKEIIGFSGLDESNSLSVKAALERIRERKNNER
jgi:hypothetical protein